VFYSKCNSAALRFGDVIHGFPLCSAVINKPPLALVDYKYHLDVEIPEFSVVLSPCCSIGPSTISICPLKPVLKTFFKNPHFVDDLTTLNRFLAPDKTVPPEEWEALEEEKKQRMKPGYMFYPLFVYAPHALLPTYDVTIRGETINVGHHMVDFRDAVKVKCGEIKSAKDAPLRLKKLELSVETRRDLREKLGAYFHRPAEEDEAVLGAVR